MKYTECQGCDNFKNVDGLDTCPVESKCVEDRSQFVRKDIDYSGLFQGPEVKRTLIQWIKDQWYRWDKRLTTEWLINATFSQRMSEQQIANEIGCSKQLVNEKMQFIYNHSDQMLNVYTGYFHYTKGFFIPLLSPYIKKVSKGIDSVYAKTSSRNSRIFKTILSEMDEQDRDTETRYSTFYKLMPRKALYLLAMKFFICLYEFDPYYAERIDYVLKRTLDHKDELYLDETANPQNWYPNRNTKLWVTRIVKGRR